MPAKVNAPKVENFLKGFRIYALLRNVTENKLFLNFAYLFTQKLIKSVLHVFTHITISMHFFALKRQKDKCKFLSFLEYRVSLLVVS